MKSARNVLKSLWCCLFFVFLRGCHFHLYYRFMKGELHGLPGNA